MGNGSLLLLRPPRHHVWLWCGQPNGRLGDAGNESVVVLALWGPMSCLPTYLCNLAMMMKMLKFSYVRSAKPKLSAHAGW